MGKMAKTRQRRTQLRRMLRLIHALDPADRTRLLSQLVPDTSDGVIDLRLLQQAAQAARYGQAVRGGDCP
jgi:hypothetical protein